MFLKTLIVIVNLWRRRDGRTEKILKFDRHFPKVTSVNNRFPPHPSVLTIQILFSGEVRSILLAKPWLFFAQTQDAVKVFKVRLSGLQPIVSYVNSDIRNVLFRDLQINRVGVSVVHEKLFRGNLTSCALKLGKVVIQTQLPKRFCIVTEFTNRYSMTWNESI